MFATFPIWLNWAFILVLILWVAWRNRKCAGFILIIRALSMFLITGIAILVFGATIGLTLLGSFAGATALFHWSCAFGSRPK